MYVRIPSYPHGYLAISNAIRNCPTETKHCCLNLTADIYNLLNSAALTRKGSISIKTVQSGTIPNVPLITVRHAVHTQGNAPKNMLCRCTHMHRTRYLRHMYSAEHDNVTCILGRMTSHARSECSSSSINSST